MKLGIVLTLKPYVGGAFTYAAFLLEAISRQIDGVDEVVAYYTEELWEKYLSRYERIRCVHLCGEYFDNIDVLNRSGCDIILVSCQTYLCRDISIPTITPIHDLMHIYEHGKGFPELDDDDCYNFRQWYVTDIYLFSAGILTDSELGKKQVLEQYGRVKEDRVYSLPFSVPFYLNEDYGISTPPVQGKYFFYPAQFWKEKNHEALVKAAALLKQKGITIRVVFAGSDKGYLDDIKQLIATEGVVEQFEILGFVPDNEMYMLYKNARAMIMPSFGGPTNLPPLEAMYVGCPVAVSNNYAMPEQVGEAGLSFDPNDVNGIAKVLEELWCDDYLCKELSEKGKERVKKFSIDNFSNNLVNCIKDVYNKEKLISGLIKDFVAKTSSKGRVYIYGAGVYARAVFALLKYFGGDVDGFIISGQPPITRFMGKNIYSISSYNHSVDDVIILGLHPENYATVLGTMANYSISSNNVIKLTEDLLCAMHRFFATGQGKICLSKLHDYCK